MSSKKRKIQLEASESGRLFHDNWTRKYGAIKHNDKTFAAFLKNLLLHTIALL